MKPFNRLLPVAFVVASCLYSSVAAGVELQNRPERLEWLQDNGFGLFVHWSIDSQLGSVISHSLVGASDDYTKSYFNELPKTFNPRHWNPDELAELAKICGAKYVVFTAKHHNGFCMWDTKTTSFNIMNTPASPYNSSCCIRCASTSSSPVSK
jgi:alpha-L-fucosidase